MLSALPLPPGPPAAAKPAPPPPAAPPGPFWPFVGPPAQSVVCAPAPLPEPSIVAAPPRTIASGAMIAQPRGPVARHIVPGPNVTLSARIAVTASSFVDSVIDFTAIASPVVLFVSMPLSVLNSRLPDSASGPPITSVHVSSCAEYDTHASSRFGVPASGESRFAEKPQPATRNNSG